MKMKKCPFCHKQVPEGATVCNGCGAYEIDNEEASSTIKNVIYFAFPPIMLLELIYALLLRYVPQKIIENNTGILLLGAAIIWGVYFIKIYTPWANKKVWRIWR